LVGRFGQFEPPGKTATSPNTLSAHEPALNSPTAPGVASKKISKFQQLQRWYAAGGTREIHVSPPCVRHEHMVRLDDYHERPLDVAFWHFATLQAERSMSAFKSFPTSMTVTTAVPVVGIVATNLRWSHDNPDISAAH
jgi:hypothetical protein